MCTVHDSVTAVPVAGDRTTPASAGYAMPAEWDRHAACLMAWPTRRALWQDRFDDARRDYAAVARAVADHEPVLMVCLPGTAEVRNLCGRAVDVIELPINDSWTSSSRPTREAPTPKRSTSSAACTRTVK